MTPSAKEVIAMALYEYSGSGQGVDDMLAEIAMAQTDAILAALEAAGYVVTKVHERRAGMQIVHHGGLAYVVHPDIPLHVWDGKTMTRVTAEAQEKQG